MSLREEAKARLQAGTAPKTRGDVLDPDALTLLYRLASDPASATDALKLLHELQVHQVELDLQIQQIETNEREFEGKLQHFEALYSSAPFAYFVVDNEGVIAQGNRIGADLTGLKPEDLAGLRIDGFLRPESRSKLLAVLGEADSEVRALEVRIDGADDTARTLVVTRPSGKAEHILLAIY